VEVVDPRSLVPLDLETILASLRKTGRLLLVEEAVTRGSVGADIAAEVAGQALDALDAPVVRLGAPPVPIPFSPVLESLVKPSLHQIESAVRSFRIGSDPKES
jgi:pyruvate dehydrogenase E1 component beta subunit